MPDYRRSLVAGETFSETSFKNECTYNLHNALQTMFTSNSDFIINRKWKLAIPVNSIDWNDFHLF